MKPSDRGIVISTLFDFILDGNQRCLMGRADGLSFLPGFPLFRTVWYMQKQTLETN